MAEPPSPPWTLECIWCDYRIIVFARGMSGNDMGSGVEAAELMERHISRIHDKTWAEFISKEK